MDQIICAKRLLVGKDGEMVSEENIWKVETFVLKASGAQCLISM